MPMLSEVKYQSGIDGFENISPQSVLTMLHDVRAELAKLEPSFRTSRLLNPCGLNAVKSAVESRLYGEETYLF